MRMLSGTLHLLLFAALLSIVYPAVAQPVSPEQQAYSLLKNAQTDSARTDACIALAKARIQGTIDFPKARKALDSVWIFAKRSGQPSILASAWNAEGVYYHTLGDRAKALEAYLNALKISETLSDSRHARDLYNIALVYQDFSDDPKATEYFQQAEALAQKAGNTDLLASIYGGMGVMFGKKGEYLKAEPYLRKSYNIRLNSAKSTPANILESMASLVRVYVGTNRAETAFPLIDSMLTLAQTTNTPQFVIQGYVMRAKAYDALKKPAEALAASEASLEALNEMGKGGNPMLSELVYERLAKSRFAAGKFEAAYMALKRSHAVHDSLFTQQRQRNIQMAEAKYQGEKKQREIEALTFTQRLSLAGIVVLLLLALLILLLWNRSRLKLKLETQQRHIAEQELTLAQSQLADFTELLVEKNTLIEQIRGTAIQGEPAPSEADDATTEAALNKLLDSALLTGADWERFRMLFERVYPGFIDRLMKRFPDLTGGEIRLLTTARLGLPAKEVAGMMGISPESVRKARHRARRKMGLTEETDLDRYIASL